MITITARFVNKLNELLVVVTLEVQLSGCEKVGANRGGAIDLVAILERGIRGRGAQSSKHCGALHYQSQSTDEHISGEPSTPHSPIQSRSSHLSQ